MENSLMIEYITYFIGLTFPILLVFLIYLDAMIKSRNRRISDLQIYLITVLILLLIILSIILALGK